MYKNFVNEKSFTSTNTAISDASNIFITVCIFVILRKSSREDNMNIAMLNVYMRDILVM